MKTTIRRTFNEASQARLPDNPRPLEIAQWLRDLGVQQSIPRDEDPWDMEFAKFYASRGFNYAAAIIEDKFPEKA